VSDSFACRPPLFFAISAAPLPPRLMEHTDAPTSWIHGLVAFFAKPKAYAFLRFGERKKCVYYSYELLRILTYAFASASLGLSWWYISFDPDVADLSAEGGILWTNSCDTSSGCTTTMAWDDRETVLKSGQIAALSCVVCAILASFAWRCGRCSVLSLIFSRPRFTAESAERFVDDQGSRVGAAEAKRRLQGLVFLLLGDVVVVILLIISIAVFTGRVRAWYAEFILSAPGNGSAYTSQLSWASGCAAGSVALACAIVAGIVPVLGIVLERHGWTPLAQQAGLGGP
jgi:hypothetical protein